MIGVVDDRQFYEEEAQRTVQWFRGTRQYRRLVLGLRLFGCAWLAAPLVVVPVFGLLLRTSATFPLVMVDGLVAFVGWGLVVSGMVALRPNLAPGTVLRWAFYRAVARDAVFGIRTEP